MELNFLPIAAPSQAPCPLYPTTLSSLPKLFPVIHHPMSFKLNSSSLNFHFVFIKLLFIIFGIHYLLHHFIQLVVTDHPLLSSIDPIPRLHRLDLTGFQV